MSVKQYELPLTYVRDAPAEIASADESACVREQQIIDEALAILGRRHRKGALLASPESTIEFLRIQLAGEGNERFGCIFLTNRHCVIAIEDLFFGTIDGAAVHPRVVVERALFHRAAALFAYHNHPSGIAEPSRADIALTARLKDALALVDVRLLDHFIVAVDHHCSFAERGLL